MLRIVRSLDRVVWQNFADEHPHSNIFHTPAMFQAFADTQGYQPELWAAIDENNKIHVLFLPVKITLQGGLGVFTARSVAYGSILVSPSLAGEQALAQLLASYIQETGRNSLFTEFRNLSDNSAIQPILAKYNFSYEEHLNYLVDLNRPVDEIWASLKGDVRTNVRKARKKGLIITEATTLEDIRLGYSILENVYHRIHVPLAPRLLFENVFENLYPHKHVMCLLAWVDQVCVGMAFRLLYKGTIYAWYAGMNKDYAAYKVQDMLNWHIIEWGAQNGYTIFDFGGAGRPDESYGPREYKARYKGELVNYGRNMYVHFPLALNLSKSVYQLYRRFL